MSALVGKSLGPSRLINWAVQGEQSRRYRPYRPRSPNLRLPFYHLHLCLWQFLLKFKSLLYLSNLSQISFPTENNASDDAKSKQSPLPKKSFQTPLQILYDVFISYNSADQIWVRTELLPRLEQTGLRVAIDYRDFIVGMPRLENVERAVESSRRTIAVLTPEWLASDWNALESWIISSTDPAARQRKLLPVLLKPCQLPKRLNALEKVDVTVERHWDRQIERLIRDIEDVIPIPAPWQEPGGVRSLRQWQRWLRRYRHRLAWSLTGLLVLWLTLFMLLELPPFHPRQVWVAQSLEAPEAQVLHNTGTALVVGAANTKSGCIHPHQGLWHRSLEPDNSWQVSNVNPELLCIKEWNPLPALSDIVALSSLPAEPNTIYALTSHSGLLVSTDAGTNFSRHPASDKIPNLEAENRSSALVISGMQSPVFWIASANSGLLVYRDDQWLRLDGQGESGCAGLPALTVTALLVANETVLIGSDQQGLWVSYDGGHTCRQVFDAIHRYEFGGVWDVSLETHSRYLALVYNWKVEPQDDQAGWQLLNLCPHANACSHTEWQAEPNPVWQDTSFLQPDVDDVLVQPASSGDYEWYLVTQTGQIWRGDLRGNKPERLPGLTRCYNFFNICFVRLATAGPDKYPYLLAAGRVYEYIQGTWSRRIWP